MKVSNEASSWGFDLAGPQVGLTCMHETCDKGLVIGQTGLNVDAGPISYFETNDCLPFILDSGASCHMTPIRELFEGINPCTGKVMMGDASCLEIVGYGNVNLLNEMLYVLKL